MNYPRIVATISLVTAWLGSIWTLFYPTIYLRHGTIPEIDKYLYLLVEGKYCFITLTLVSLPVYIYTLKNKVLVLYLSFMFSVIVFIIHIVAFLYLNQEGGITVLTSKTSSAYLPIHPEYLCTTLSLVALYNLPGLFCYINHRKTNAKTQQGVM